MTAQNDVTLSPELATLMSQAVALDGESAPAGSLPVEQAPPSDPVAETAAVLGVAIGLLVPLLPYLEPIYTAEVQQRIAAAYVPVAEKYGWQVGGGIFEKFGPEIMLGATVLPLAVQTGKAHKAWVDERAKAAEQDKFGAMRREADARQHFEVTRGLPSGSLGEETGGTVQFT